VSRVVARGLRVEELQNAPTPRGTFDVTRPVQTTLLDLVRTLSAVTDDDQVVVATITSMVNSGQVVLRGIYRGCRFPTS
jgi:hypothetical protein